MEKNKIVFSAKDIVSLSKKLKAGKKEYLACFYLDPRNFLIKAEIIFEGNAHKRVFHPREIFYPALELRAASIAIAHRHLSGTAEPEKEDVEMVNKIAKAGEILGIEIADFVIIAKNKFYSFFEGAQKKKGDADYVCDGRKIVYLSDLLANAANPSAPIFPPPAGNWQGGDE